MRRGDQSSPNCLLHWTQLKTPGWIFSGLRGTGCLRDSLGFAEDPTGVKFENVPTTGDPHERCNSIRSQELIRNKARNSQNCALLEQAYAIVSALTQRAENNLHVSLIENYPGTLEILGEPIRQVTKAAKSHPAHRSISRKPPNGRTIFPLRTCIPKKRRATEWEGEMEGGGGSELQEEW